MEEERISSSSNCDNNKKEEVERGGGEEKEAVYKTKVIQFLGRSTPIVLQNDNGPCPLLAICNVLLLRNSLHLNLDAPEVSLQKLLSLVAEKLIDSNSNTQDKDDGYLINQQQNIADAIDLLPRLATGIDVNVQFRKINDFEFTRECAIFDLLDIGIYHGWIVDPQDTATASAIGSKSYNTLVGDLVAFEASKPDGEETNAVEEDSVDFAAATTATLGVPSPCLSRGRSFDDSPIQISDEQGSSKGDREEAEELMRALNLSKTEMSTPVTLSVSTDANSSHMLEGNSQTGCFASEIHLDASDTQIGVESEESRPADLVSPQRISASIGFNGDGLDSNVSSTENVVMSTNTNGIIKVDDPVSEDSAESMICSSSMDYGRTNLLRPNQGPSFQSADGESPYGFDAFKALSITSKEEPSQKSSGDLVTSQLPSKPVDNPMGSDSAVYSVQAVQYADFHSSNGTKELCVVGSSSLDDSEPIYEGEECILDSGLPRYEDREPVYEGEVVLAEQADKTKGEACVNLQEKVDLQQCHLIRNFLENSASQLTIYGLFCLQEGLKERELCVFFRNNHFSTMFKFNGELYLLATDQGYINQPDLVWEKLNEVNGDTVFMTGNFTEFKIENQFNESWNEQNAMTSTADYLATLEASPPAISSFNSDLQLAIALQQQEFGQQAQQQPQRSQQSSQQAAVTGRPRLVTGPQVTRSQQSPQKNESKKDKCTIM